MGEIEAIIGGICLFVFIAMLPALFRLWRFKCRADKVWKNMHKPMNEEQLEALKRDFDQLQREWEAWRP